MRSVRTNLFAALLVVLVASSAHAAPVVVGLTTTLDFEDLTDLSSLTSQYAAFGVTFDGPVALTAGSAGGSLNDFDFPPRSGTNVIYNFGTDMMVSFDSVITSFSAYVTYAGPVALLAYNMGALVGSATTLAESNYVSSGNPTPNELLTFSGVFDQIILTGGEFVLDDASFTVQDTTGVPEPGTLALALVGLAGCASRIRRNRTTK